MSQHNSRRVEFGVRVDPAIVAMGAVVTTALTTEPWRDPSVQRLRAYHSGHAHKLPPEYKVDLTS